MARRTRGAREGVRLRLRGRVEDKGKNLHVEDAFFFHSHTILNQGVNSLHECSWNRHLLTLYIIASICCSKHSINDQVESRIQSGLKSIRATSNISGSSLIDVDPLPQIKLFLSPVHVDPSTLTKCTSFRLELNL